MIRDIIILGSGPAGLTAALYGARANKKILALGGDSLGGQMAGIHRIENYPGFTGGGMELAEVMKKQAESFGAEIISESAVKIAKNGATWSVQTHKEIFESKSVIIATGASPRKLDLSGVREFTGRGVSYCATCDGFFYNGKTVAVYGGGNSALEDALYLSNLAQKVYIIYRKAAFTRAEAILVERVKNTDNIECIFETEIETLGGNDAGLTHINTNKGQKIEIDGLFVAIGHEANTDFLPEEYKRDNLGRLVADGPKIEDGLFVAGDVRSDNKMQVCVATGWGCEAAMDAIAYVNQL